MRSYRDFVMKQESPKCRKEAPSSKTSMCREVSGTDAKDSGLTINCSSIAFIYIDVNLNALDNLPKTWDLTPIEQNHVRPEYRWSEEIRRRHNLDQQQLRVLQQHSDRE